MAFTIETSLSGIHSRSESTVATSRAYDRGRASQSSLNATFNNDSRNLLELEIKSGFTKISDGQLRWQDYLRPFSENLEGLALGADLSRWFDTNSFYRKPTVNGEVKLSSKKGKEFPIKNYELMTSLSRFAPRGKKGKQNFNRTVAIPGPYTFASLVDDRYYGSKENLVFAFASVMRDVVQFLSKKGFGTVQLNEPSLVYRYGKSALTDKKELEVFLASYEKYFATLGSNLVLHTYFGDSSKILGDLTKLEGVGVIGVDFTQTSLADLKGIEFDGKVMGCGCVDGRNSLVESPEWIAKYCQDAVRTLKPSGLLILPSCEMKYLPRTFADKKIHSIGRAAKLLRKQMKEGSS